MSKSKKIAEYARMASDEAHEEYMNYEPQPFDYYAKDIIAEMIDKFDTIQAMATKKWWQK